MTRRLPEPGIFEMYDWRGRDPATKPAWGPHGAWMYWRWDKIELRQGVYDWTPIEQYLDKAAAMGKPIIVGIMILEAPDMDCTPTFYGEGWPVIKNGAPTGETFPKWNDPVWNPAFQRMVGAFGAAYDGDPRVHSVRICTAEYGETVTMHLGENQHNPLKFFQNAMRHYDLAFPTTPLYIINTGNVGRRELTELAVELGIHVEMHNLNRDLPQHCQVKNQVSPPPDAVKPWGTAEACLAYWTATGDSTAHEHKFAATQGETYWSLLSALWQRGTVVDLTPEQLDTLAAIPGLWDWWLKMASADQNCVGLYVARDTMFPTPKPNPPLSQLAYDPDWEHGWMGPFERGITTNATCYAPGTAGWKAAPAALTSTVEGHGGIGFCKGGPVIELALPAGDYEVTAIYSTDGATWLTATMRMTSPGRTGFVIGDCWLHRVTALPVEAVPEPTLEERVAVLEEEVTVLGEDQDVIEGKIGALETDLDALMRAVARLEDQMGAIHVATG